MTRVELESGFLPTPAGSAVLSVSWRARSRQIRDHHRAQRRGSSRRYKRRLTLLQEGVSWLHSLLCSAPLRRYSHSAGAGFIRNCFHPCTVAAIHESLFRRYHGPYLVVAIGFAPIYDGHAQTRRSGSPCRSRSRSTANHACSAIDEQHSWGWSIWPNEGSRWIRGFLRVGLVLACIAAVGVLGDRRNLQRRPDLAITNTNHHRNPPNGGCEFAR